MTATSHAVTGAMIAAVVKRPALVIPLAFLSHFICDAIPHFGLALPFGSLAMFAWLAIDGLAIMGIAFFLYKKRVPNKKLLATSAFVAMSPDLAWLYYGIQQTLNEAVVMDPLARVHSTIQWLEHPAGILLEFVWIGIMVGIIVRWSKRHEDYQDSATNQA